MVVGVDGGYRLIKKEKSLFLVRIKFEPIFFQVLWQFFMKGVPVLEKEVAGAPSARKLNRISF